MKTTLFLLILTFTTAAAQVKNFTLTDVTSGSTVSLDQFSGRPGVVVIFTSNDCPFDNYYTDRIGRLVTDYAGKIPFLLVNAHLDPQEAEANMKKEAAAWSFRAPYLSDKDQQAMEALSARRSPEVFLLKPGTGGFQVFYSGALDDNPQDASAVTVQYLRDAMENLLAGKPSLAPVRAAGCTIRKK